MRLLAIDLGFSNGYVYFPEAPRLDVIDEGTVDYSDLDVWLDTLDEQMITPTDVVIERTAHGEFGPAARVLTEVTFKLQRAFPKASWTKAGQWKPITGSQPIQAISGVVPSLSRHEKDAYRLGLHYLFTKGLYRLVPTRHPASGTT